MGKLSSVDIILGILYATAAIFLFIVSYLYYVKRFKRNKLEAISDVKLVTALHDIYNVKTQFLIQLSEDMKVKLSLLDENEGEVEVLADDTMTMGENLVYFDPVGKKDGIYYLSLKTENTNILRQIKIKK